jgi:hypothetical protein
MDVLTNLTKLLNNVNIQLSRIMEKIPHDTKRKQGDFTRLTNEQLDHLLDVYNNKLYGVTTYVKLADYSNKKYGLTKVTLTYYKSLDRYRNYLRNS